MIEIIKDALAVIVIVILSILLFKACNKPPIVIIKPAEIPGTFEKQEPVYVIKKDTVYLTKWWVKDSTIVVETPNPINQELAVNYKLAKDSIDKFKLYVSAIQIKDFVNHFEDTTIDLTITGQVQGELKCLIPKYTLKPHVILPDKPVLFKALIGAEIRSNLNKFDYNINLGIQDSKDNIYRVGYSRQFGSNYIMIGFDYSMFYISK